MTQNQHRRAFLRNTSLISIGVAGGLIVPKVFWSGDSNEAIAVENANTPEQRLKDLGIILPKPPSPVAVYVPAVRQGSLLFTSGHGPKQKNGTNIVGKVGKELTLKQGYDAARVTGLNVLATVRKTIRSLNHVVRLVKVLGMVNCTSTFTKQPQVVNGFSELMVQVFGEKLGKGARSAVGMGSLPGNIACEIEAIFEVRGPGL